jgi:glutamate synthase (NADPH/NADH) small chain
MQKHILDEAQRCLQCKNPRCSSGCPVNTPMNKIIGMLLDGNILDAGETLFKNNPLSVICSLVCPHEKQCEGHCVRGIKESPVRISSIEHYISNYYLNYIQSDIEKDRNKKVAIIGSGPAGITIAFILASKGYDITIFEGHDLIGGVLRYGIPEFRLPKTLLDRLKVKMEDMGIKIRPNTFIGSTITIDDLFRDEFKAIFLGIGVWNPKSLKIKGETLGHVHYAIDYLKNPNVYNLGEKLCIIGAGNVAMDVARTAIRNGVRDVTILYRGDMTDITADKIEIEYAKLDGVKFELRKSPIEITDDGVVYMDTINYTDNEGNLHIERANDEEHLFECSSVIVSISQGPKDAAFSSTKGISVNNNGLVATDDCGKTTREGVFASGDVVTGAKTVVEAVRLSKKVAQAIDEYITTKYFN